MQLLDVDWSFMNITQQEDIQEIPGAAQKSYYQLLDRRLSSIRIFVISTIPPPTVLNPSLYFTPNPFQFQVYTTSSPAQA